MSKSMQDILEEEKRAALADKQARRDRIVCAVMAGLLTDAGSFSDLPFIRYVIDLADLCIAEMDKPIVPPASEAAK